MSAASYEEILKLADTLTVDERMQLIAYLANTSRTATTDADSRPSWSDLAGTAPYPALGEDAQAWVSRTRQESDDAREAQWRKRS